MAAPRLRGQGPDCCCDCDSCCIGFDTFDKTLSQFTTTGSPSVADGLLTMTAGDSVTFTPEPTGGAEDDIVVITTPRAESGSPATFRMKVGIVDANNYAFAEFNHPAAGGSTVRLGHVIAGASSYVTEAVALPEEADQQNERYTAKVCWRPGTVITGETGFITDVKYPTAVVGSGTGWTNETGALLPFASDSAFASHALPPGPPYDSDLITFSGFFTAEDLPPMAIPDGIQVLVTCRSIPGESSPDIKITRVQLFDDDDSPYEDKGDNTIIAENTFTGYAYGNPTDGWDITLDRDLLVGILFGVALEFEWTNGTGSLDLDVVSMRCWYHTPDERQPGRISVVVGDLLVSSQAEGAGPKTGLSVTSGTVTFDDYQLKHHKDAAEFSTCPECIGTGTANCEADEPEEECSESGFALHGEPFEGGGSSVSIENPAGETFGSGTYGWCFDWSDGLQEGGYISLKANIAYSAGTGIQTIGIGFGWDTVAEHQCGFPGGGGEIAGDHCPGIGLMARPQLNFEENPGSSYRTAHVETGAASNVNLAPASGDLLEIKISCESGQLVARLYVNGSLISSMSGVNLPNPFNYNVFNTLNDSTASSASWSNIQFTYVPSAP